MLFGKIYKKEEQGFYAIANAVLTRRLICLVYNRTRTKGESSKKDKQIMKFPFEGANVDDNYWDQFYKEMEHYRPDLVKKENGKS